jgi:hypothetical protein
MMWVYVVLPVSTMYFALPGDHSRRLLNTAVSWTRASNSMSMTGAVFKSCLLYVTDGFCFLIVCFWHLAGAKGATRCAEGCSFHLVKLIQILSDWRWLEAHVSSAS